MVVSSILEAVLTVNSPIVGGGAEKGHDAPLPGGIEEGPLTGPGAHPV